LLAHQQQPQKNQTLAELLKEAESHFQAKRYLKPVNENAYLLYQAALKLDPTNELSLKRIGQMKSFYRKNGDKYFGQKNWPQALSYFERYYLIDTTTKEINQKMMVCRKKLAATRNSNTKSESTKTAASNRTGEKTKNSRTQSHKREEIRQLLEESGAESSWIMNYLFEDQQKDADSEKPW
jgi:hypothetical protein